MGSSGMWMQMAASGGATILHLAVSILFLVIAYVYVRPPRPDVWPLVAGWAGASMFLTLLHVAATSLTPAIVGSAGGHELVMSMYALITATFAILRTGVDCVLAWAIVLLAKGKKPAPFGS